MAQVMIDLHKKSLQSRKFKTVATQTVNSKNSDELCVYLTKNRTFKLFNSKSYKEYVLSFNFGNSKKFILTKLMWIKFRRYIPYIERVLLQYKATQNLRDDQQHTT